MVSLSQVRLATMMSGLCLAVMSMRASQASDPDALWKIVHDHCVPGQQQYSDPRPCAFIDMSGGAGRGYAVLKDLNGVAQYLLIPTDRLIGIDDPTVLTSGTANFFEAAWNARTFVEGKLRRSLPRDAFGLVINSVKGRTQEQFHIHIDCIRTDVRDALRIHAGAIAQAWTPFPVPPVGRHYMAMWVPGESLAPNDPIKLLASELSDARGEMGLHTLIVAGVVTSGHPGFIILDRRIAEEPGDSGKGTEVLDRACGVATGAP